MTSRLREASASQKTNITITDDIAAGANITYHMTMNVIPGYPETQCRHGRIGMGEHLRHHDRR